MDTKLTWLIEQLGPHAALYIGSTIAVLGLLYGLGDLLRFSLKRVWAISGVCFDESIRRRVLWITPVAILGVIVISQLQKPVDEQDAIRETTKFCLFTTGLVVCISTVILACTNLPREIENRVIYTVVTKPTTRLEIVLGKIVGFARVSAAILLIMGIFTWSYLHIRALGLQHDITDRLNTPGAFEPISKPTLEHYVSAGLLNAKSLATPSDNPDGMSLYSHLPKGGDNRRYFNADGLALIPFYLPDDLVVDPQSSTPAMRIQVHVGYEPTAATTTQPGPTTGSLLLTGPAPLLSSTRPAVASAGPPQLLMQIFDSNQTTLVSDINNGKPVTLDDPSGSTVSVLVSSAQASKMLKQQLVYLVLMAGTANVNYFIDENPATLSVIEASQPTHPVQLHPAQLKDGSNEPSAQFVFLGRQGTSGQQLKGDAAATAADAPVCVYRFNDVKVPRGTSEVPIELRVGVEHGDENSDAEAPVLVTLQAMNHQTGELSAPVTVTPENNRTAYASLPASLLSGGNFDVVVRCLSNDQWVSLTRTSLAIVQSESSFGMNLVKSLGILWLLAVLVVSISIFCSTFLSWPIAIVLTLVILLGHWGVEELGDAATSGLGRQFVQDFGVRDPSTSLALSFTVEQLNKGLNILAQVLPDISRFSATDDIERGISIPMATLVEALEVVLGFGIPFSVLAYVILRNKEVAP